MNTNFNFYLYFFFLIVSNSLFATDSLKVKKIEYFENRLFIQVTNYDTLNRETSVYHFTPLGVRSDKKSCFVQVTKYFKNTPIPISKTTYSFITTGDNSFFDSKLMGNRSIGFFDSTKNILKTKHETIWWDKKNKTNSFSIDSLFKLQTKYKKDYSNGKIEYKYDKNFNVIKSKRRTNGRVNYRTSSTYDAKNRVTYRIIEAKFDEIKSDTTIFINSITTKMVKEKKVLNVKHDDENRTSEWIVETYRRNKLYSKQRTKTQYNEDEKMLLQEQYKYEIENGIPKSEPTLTETDTYEYVNKLLVKVSNKYLKTNQIRVRELKYTFW